MKTIKLLLVLALGVLATLTQAATTTVSCFKNTYIGTIKVPGSSSDNYNGPLYFIYGGTGYTGKEDALKNAFKSADGLDLSNLPDGMKLLGKTMVVNGTFAEFSVEVDSSLLSSEFWATALIFSDSGYMHCTGFNNIQSSKRYNCGNNNTQTGAGAVGPGSYTEGSPLQAKATAYVGAYDGQAHNIGVTVKKIPEGLTAAISYAYSEVGPWTPAASFVPTAKDVADPVKIYAKVEDGEDDPVIVNATVSITQRVVTVTARSKTKDFDAKALTESGYDAVGFITGEGIDTLSMTADSTITKPGAVSNVVDEATVELTSDTKAGNYNISYVQGALTVNKLTTGLEVEPTPYSAVYDGEYHVFDVAVNVTGPTTGEEPTIVYSTAENGTYYPTNNMSSFTIKNWQSSAKTLWAKVSCPGYEDVKVSSTVTILKRPVTVTADSQTWIYNGSSRTCRTFTVSPDPATADAGFVGDEGLKTVNWNSASTITNPGTQPNKITSANSWKSGTTANNYALTFVDGVLTVTPSDGLTATATGWEGYYNASTHKITVTKTAPLDSITPTVTYSYDENGPFAADDGSFVWPKNVTNVTVYAKVEQTGYVSKTVSADVIIKPRHVVLKADDASRAYNGTALTKTTFTVLTYNKAGYTSAEYGFQGSQGVTLSMTADSTITDPGTQPNVIDETTIKANSYVTSAGGTLGNYIIETQNGTLTVTENPNGLRATGGNYEAFYDGSDHNITVNVTQCPSGKTAAISYSLTGEDGSYVPAAEFTPFRNASDAAITVYAKVELFGYKTVNLTQTVFIKKRTVTVTANSTTWVVDGEWHSDNGFKVTPATPDDDGNGFIVGEGIEAVEMTEASKIQEVGTVDNVIDQEKIEVIGDTNLANYNITFKKGTLKVRLPPAITLTPYNNATFYGADGNAMDGKMYILHSQTTGFDQTTPTTMINAFKSDAGLDLAKLDVLCPGTGSAKLEVCAEFSIASGKFVGDAVFLTGGYNGNYRWMLISKGSDGKDYIYINNNQSWSDDNTYTINIPSNLTWNGPGHLASAAEPTADAGTLTKGTDGNYTVTDIIPGTTDLAITIPSGVPETATFKVPVDELNTVTGVPEGRLIVTVNGIEVDLKYFTGYGTGTVFDANLSDAAKPTLIEETATEKPLVVGDDVSLTVDVVPGLTYQLLRATDLSAAEPQFGNCGDAQTAAAEQTTLTLEDTDKPADRAFYKVGVSK